jgi:hypothetical protein
MQYSKPKKDNFWTDELVKEFLTFEHSRISKGNILWQTLMDEFKQSKTQPIFSGKERIKINSIRHASVTSSVISIDFDSPVSSETFPSIQSAIEKIINNE